MKTMKFYIKPETKVSELQTADGLLTSISQGIGTNPDTAEDRDEYYFDDEEELW